MTRAPIALLAFAVVPILYAQDGAQPAGLETPWSIAPVIKELSAHAGRLLAALERIDTKTWVEKGASETYGDQLQACKVQTRALEDGANALSQNPEQLAPSIELMLRMQAVDNMLGSIEEGMRKYQKPADAEALIGLAAEGGPNRTRFQKYVVDLADDRDRQLKIMNEEAQRCRTLLTSPAASAPKTGKKK